MLDIHISTEDSVTLARLHGELSAADAEELTEAVHEYAAGPDAKLVIDLSGVPSIDSTGLSALIALVTRARLGQGQVLVAAPTKFVAGVLNATRLDSWLEVCASVEEATRRLEST